MIDQRLQRLPASRAEEIGPGPHRAFIDEGPVEARLDPMREAGRMTAEKPFEQAAHGAMVPRARGERNLPMAVILRLAWRAVDA